MKLPEKLELDLFSIIDDDLNDELFEAINNYLSDTYGYCTNCVGILKDKIKICVDWDTTE